MTNQFDTHTGLMQNNRVIVITHPKKAGAHAEIIIKYPKDGAGRLRVSLRDCFGDTCTFSTGYAGGYGYDKLTAALSSLAIDGHALTDHCGQDVTGAKLLKAHQKHYASGDQLRLENTERACKSAGYSFANWEQGRGWGSCYRLPGLDYLRAIGYSVLTIG
jgi:hypothetical protein